MKVLFSLVLAAALAGCAQNSNNTTSAADSTQTTISAAVTGNPAAMHLLAGYKPINLDTLQVYIDYNHLDSTGYAFKGQPLDTAAMRYLTGNPLSSVGDSLTYYACYRFNINDSALGLLTRDPGNFDQHVIQLYILNTNTGKVSTPYALSVLGGDAGDTWEKRGWLMNGKGGMQVFEHTLQTHDHQAEDEKDTAVDYYHDYTLIKLGYNTADTLSKDSTKLKQQFGHLLQAAK